MNTLIAVCFACGLLAGWLVVQISFRLPVAMERAWQREGQREGQGEDAPGPVVTVSRWYQGLGALVCALAFTVPGLRLGLSWALPAVLVATAALMSLAIIDWKHRLLPDVIVYPLLGVGVLVNAVGLLIPFQDAVIGAVVGYGSLWSVSRGYRLAFRVTGMGEGDLKLLAALGAWLGWQALLPVAFVAAVMALAVSLGRCLFCGNGAAEDRLLPYGSYMAVAGWSLLAGQRLPGLAFVIPGGG